MKTKIKDAWQKAKCQQKLHDEKKSTTESIVTKRGEIVQKISDLEGQMSRSLEDRPATAKRFACGEISEAEFEMACPDAAVHRQKLQAFRSMLQALDLELKHCSGAQRDEKHVLNQALHRAWMLVAQAELLEIMPGLLRCYAAFSTGKIESENGYSESSFAIEMLSESFKTYQQEIYKARDKFKREYREYTR